MIDYELSTLQSLTRHEAEINNLVSRYTRKACSVAAITQLTATPDTITAITAVKSNGTSIALTKGASTWPLPIGEYVRLICTLQGDSFSLLEGTGSIITSKAGLYTLTFGSAPTWTDVELEDDWQSKIDVANETIYFDLYAALANKVGSVNVSDVIAGIVNPEALCLASDYKTMELIYADLAGKIGTSEITTFKQNYYSAKYDEFKEKAFASLDFGDYGYLFTTNMGRVIR